VLARDRGEPTGLLKVTGRDIPEGEYALRFEDGCRWQLDGADLAAAARRARDQRATAGLGDRSAEVVGYVNAHPEGVSPFQVGAALGLDPKTAGTYLGRAARAGRIANPARGLYAPVGSVESVERRDGDLSGFNTFNAFNTPSGDDGDPSRWSR
jgi:hypothetical protein